MLNKFTGSRSRFLPPRRGKRKGSVGSGLKRQSSVQVLKSRREINASRVKGKSSQRWSRSRCFSWALMVTLITSSDSYRPSRPVSAGSTFSPGPTQVFLRKGERETINLLFSLGSWSFLYSLEKDALWVSRNRGFRKGEDCLRGTTEMGTVFGDVACPFSTCSARGFLPSRRLQE